MLKPVLKKFTNKAAVILLLLLLVAYFPLFAGRTLFWGDNFSLMMPGKIFSAHWLRQGILPLWNPYYFSGLPWLADINESLLYPNTLLFALFNPSIALNLTILSHVALALLACTC